MKYQDKHKILTKGFSKTLCVALALLMSNAVYSAPAKAKTTQAQKITLDFQDIPVRQVLQLLGEYTGTNIAVADSVQGNITLKLTQVPVQQALEVILQTKNLAKKQNGNVLLIAPYSELLKAENERKQYLQAQQNNSVANGQGNTEKTSATTTPARVNMHTTFIHLNYAKAEDVAKLIQNAKSQNKTTNNAEQAKNIDLQTASLLSPQGVVSFDERTNTLILHDSEEKLNQLRYLIAVLDVPVNQVMVEARIVRANTNFSKELGVRWGIFGARDNAKLTIGSNSNSLWDLRTEGIQQRPSRLNIDLGVANASAGTFAIGLLGLENLVLDLELSALQSEGYGEIISTPKVLTLDKQKASISTGQEMPYQVANNVSGNTVVSTAFKDAVLKLDVVPVIMPNNKVQMQLQVTNNSPAGFTSTGGIILNKNELETVVVVNDGETIVLGGVYEHSQQNSQNKIPVLGDIPKIGSLFRKKINTNDKRELLIFITPRIVNDTSYRNE